MTMTTATNSAAATTATTTKAASGENNITASAPVASPNAVIGTHPLQRSWTLWYDSPSTYSNVKWELSLKPIMTVHTVEEFFLMLRYIRPVHALRTATQYHFFQEKIKPMWEDSANKNGGKIWVNIDINKNAEPEVEGEKGKTKMDLMWENVLMALVGEYLEDETASGESHITGVVMTKRKYLHRLSVWVKDYEAKEVVEGIKRRLIKETGLPATTKLEFSKHETKTYERE